MTRSNRVDHIRITSHPAPGGKLKFPILWGGRSARVLRPPPDRKRLLCARIGVGRETDMICSVCALHSQTVPVKEHGPSHAMGLSRVGAHGSGAR